MFFKFIYRPAPAIVDPKFWQQPEWEDPGNVRQLYEAIREQVVDRNLDSKFHTDKYSLFGGLGT